MTSGLKWNYKIHEKLKFTITRFNLIYKFQYKLVELF